MTLLSWLFQNDNINIAIAVGLTSLYPGPGPYITNFNINDVIFTAVKISEKKCK